MIQSIILVCLLLPCVAMADDIAVNDIFHLPKETTEPSYTLDVLVNDVDGDALSLVAAMSLDASVDIEQNQVVLSIPADSMSQLSINYVVQDTQGNYYSAQADVIFDLVN